MKQATNSLRRKSKPAERVHHLAHEVAAAAVEQGGVPHDDVPHVDQLRQRMPFLVHDLLGPLDGLHELLFAQNKIITNTAIPLVPTPTDDCIHGLTAKLDCLDTNVRFVPGSSHEATPSPMLLSPRS